MKNNLKQAAEIRSLDAWRGDTCGLALEQEDLELVDNVLCIVPGMRAVAFLGREARKRGLKYPVTSVWQLIELLRGDTFLLSGHRVDAKAIADALHKEWFPLAHEGELLSVIHLGLRRCEADRAAAVLDDLKTRGFSPSPTRPETSKRPKGIEKTTRAKKAKKR
jgi:hypothetical protein